MAWRQEQSGDIVIDGWENGIGKTPFDGLTDVRNVDILSSPKCVTAKLKPLRANTASVATTFTVDVATNIVTVASSLRFTYPNGNNNANGLTCTLTNSGGALPAGLATNTLYWIILDASTTTFKLANSFANYLVGTEVDITDTGTGTHTITTSSMGAPIDYSVYTYGIVSSVYIFALIDVYGKVWINKIGLATSYNTFQWVELTRGNHFGIVSGGASLQFFQDSLFVFHNSVIDVYYRVNSFSTAGTWYNSWKTGLTSTFRHITFKGSDGKLYWTDASATTSSALGYIGSLGQNSTTLIFSDTNNPTTSTNYTYTPIALDLPSGEIPTAIDELGSNLIIGTITNKMYPWDRVSDSFSIPINLPDRNVRRFINLNNILYIFAGVSGTVYKTNGSQIVPAFNIPKHLYYNSSGTYINRQVMTWGAIETLKNSIILSVSSNGYKGLYNYNVDTDVLVMDTELEGSSSQSDSVTALFLITDSDLSTFPGNPPPSGLTDFRYTYVYGSGGLGYVYDTVFTEPYTDDSCFVISDAIPVGTFLRKKTLQQIEFKLIRPMSLVGDYISFSYRLNLGTSVAFTPINNYIYDSANPNIISFEYPINVENAEWLQLKIVLRAGRGTGSSNVPLREIRIR